MKIRFILLCVSCFIAASWSVSAAQDIARRDEAMNEILSDIETDPIIVTPAATIDEEPYIIPSSVAESRQPDAEPATETEEDPTTGRFSVGADVGYLNGHTVYNFFNKRSELLYPMNNWMVRPSVTYELDRISLMCSVMTTLENDAGNEMHDRDWLDHGDVLFSDTVSQSSMDAMLIDASLRYDFFRKTLTEDLEGLSLHAGDRMRFGVLAGYAYQRFDYDLYDIYYRTDLFYGAEGTTDLPGTRVLTYQASYYMPYIGLAGDVASKNWGIGADIKFSFSPTAEDIDNHILRGTSTGQGTLTFYGDYDDGTAWMGSLHGFWRVLPSWKAKCGFDFTAANIEGDTHDSTNDPGWMVDQSTELYHGFLWGGLEYTF